MELVLCVDVLHSISLAVTSGQPAVCTQQTGRFCPHTVAIHVHAAWGKVFKVAGNLCGARGQVCEHIRGKHG